MICAPVRNYTVCEVNFLIPAVCRFRTLIRAAVVAEAQIYILTRLCIIISRTGAWLPQGPLKQTKVIYPKYYKNSKKSCTTPSPRVTRISGIPEFRVTRKSR